MHIRKTKKVLYIVSNIFPTKLHTSFYPSPSLLTTLLPMAWVCAILPPVILKFGFQLQMWFLRISLTQLESQDKIDNMFWPIKISTDFLCKKESKKISFDTFALYYLIVKVDILTPVVALVSFYCSQTRPGDSLISQNTLHVLSMMFFLTVHHELTIQWYLG